VMRARPEQGCAEVLLERVVGSDQRSSDRPEQDDRQEDRPGRERGLTVPPPHAARLGVFGDLDKGWIGQGDRAHRSSRTLWSRAAYDISAARLTSTTSTPNTSVTPCTTGKSRWKIELSISCPMPGIAKTFSMMTVPPIRKPMLMPSTVTAGM